MYSPLYSSLFSPIADKPKVKSYTVTKQMDKVQDSAIDVALDLKDYTFEIKPDFFSILTTRFPRSSMSYEG